MKDDVWEEMRRVMREESEGDFKKGKRIRGEGSSDKGHEEGMKGLYLPGKSRSLCFCCSCGDISSGISWGEQSLSTTH
jgi:hypothetical protein